jgi:tetratricopeptide (TPR) repeat protein
VVLYELLASRHPLWEKTPTFLDAARIVRTQEPRPLAASDRSLRGDLATIVAKALAKEPRCRYHSAQELAADLGRFLRDEPISARPATPMYQLGKLARRNPRLVGACAAVLLSLALGLGAALWGLARAQEALRETTAARAAAAEQAVLAHRRADAAREAARFLGDIIAAASPRSGNASAPLGQVSVAAAEQIEAAPPEDPLVEAAIRDALGEVFIGQGELDKAERQIERAMELRTRVSGAASADALDSTLMLAVLRMEQGRCQEVEAMIRPACELAARSLGESAPLSRNLLATWGVSLTMVGDLAGAERAISRSLELTLAQENPEPCEVAQIRGQYGAVLEALGRHSEAETSLRATIEAMEAMELPDDDVAVVARINLASALVELRPAEALAMARDVVARTERVAQGRENSRSLMARAVFAGCLLANGTAAEAEAELRNLRPAAEQLFGPDNAEVVNMDAMLAAALCGQGRHEEALTIFDGVAAKSGAFGPTDSWRLVRIKLDHARCCLHAGRAEDAATLAEEALAAAKASFGPEDARSRAAQGLLEEAGRASEIVAAR